MAQQNNKKEMVSVIIPAFNEATRIGAVLEVVCSHPMIDEVIVVDDGSEDGTAEVARCYTDNVIVCEKNMGKARAMDKGVTRAKHDIIFFVDADLQNFTHDNIDKIILPVVEGRYGMYCGLRDKKVYWMNKISRFTPIVTGERALRKKIWHLVSEHYKHGFQIEIALNFFAKKSGLGMGFELLSGYDHQRKSQKYGFVKGWLQFFGMVLQIIWVGVKVYGGENVKWFFEKMRARVRGRRR